MLHPTLTGESLGACVDALRDAAPVTQCLTNEVAIGFTANVLLAAGASPAMVSSAEEGPIFATMADGLLINVGTVNEATAVAMRDTARARNVAGRAWCLDPVAVGVLPQRTSLARDLLGFGPSVIRGNASEILGLSGDSGSGRGVDAGDSVEGAHAAASALSTKGHGVVAVSGAVDALYAAWNSGPVRISNGHPLMTRVTGVGCALGALVAAYLAVAPDALVAASAATATLTIAAEAAAERAAGPGSFAVELLDALALTDGGVVADRVRLAVPEKVAVD